MASDLYKNKLRIRVSGLLKEDGKILMIQLNSPVTNELVWMLPGGGLKFGEKMKDCLKREFKEETGLAIVPADLVAVNELIQSSFHAIECYFSVRKTGGKLQLGHDPEYGEDDQVVTHVQWIPVDRLAEIDTAPEQIKQWVKESGSDSSLNFYSQAT